MPDSNRDEIEKLEKLYASNPAGRVFTHLAEAYRKAGDLDRASELLDAGLLQHPDYPSAYVVLGRVKLDREEREEAASAFRRVLELDRHNLVAIRALGDLAVEAGRFEEARHYLGELIQIDPSDLESAERLEQLPVETALGGIEPEAGWDEPAAEGNGWLAQAEETAGEPGDFASTGATAEVPDDDEASAGERDWGEVTLEKATADEGTIESVPAPGSWLREDVEAEDGTPAKADEPAAGSAPLDAWVESLDVIDPALDLPESADQMVEEPEVEAVLEADPGEVEGDVVTLEAVESDDGTGIVWEVDPGPEPVAEADRAVGEDSDVVSGESEDEPESLMDLEVAEPGLAAAAEVESMDAAGTEAGDGVSAADEAGAQPDPETTWWGDPEVHVKVPDPVEWVSQEDWERIAGYGARAGSGAPEEEAEAVPQIESEWGAADLDEDADEVATETLAEVYAAQGFRAEAAEIYRKLLRRRPEDPRLLSRLSALETERAEPARDEVGFEVAEEPGEVAATGQAWLEKTESMWPGGDEQADAGPTPYAWIESGATEPDAGETIGDRLRGLLAWRPESAPESEPMILLEDVAENVPLPDFPTFGSGAAGHEGVVPDRPDADTEDLEMFRSWLKSLRK